MNPFRGRFRAALLSAPAWRLFLALSLLLVLRARFLRPVDLIFPATVAQLIIFLLASQTIQPLYTITVGNIILAGVGMMPGILRVRQRP